MTNDQAPQTPDDDGNWRKWRHEIREELQRLTMIDQPTGHQKHRRRLLTQQLEAHEEAISE